MNELMRAEILDQPQALSQSLGRLRQELAALSLSATSYRSIILAGSGDSFIAPLALSYAARLCGMNNVHVLPALDASEYWPFAAEDLLVCISVSGKAPQTIRAAQAARKQIASILAITAAADSPLAEISTDILWLPFKSRSRQTPHTTDYLSTLMALTTFIEHMTENKFNFLDVLAETVAEAISITESPCMKIGNSLKLSDKLIFLGGGPNYASGSYGAAKFWEAGGLIAAAFDIEEFAHGPHLIVDPGDPIFVIAPQGKSFNRAKEIISGLQELQGKVVVITNASEELEGADTLTIPDISEEWSPFLTAIPLQWICLAVSNAKGYDVIAKDGRHANASQYEQAHRRWVSFPDGQT